MPRVRHEDISFEYNFQSGSIGSNCGSSMITGLNGSMRFTPIPSSSIEKIFTSAYIAKNKFVLPTKKSLVNRYLERAPEPRGVQGWHIIKAYWLGGLTKAGHTMLKEWLDKFEDNIEEKMAESGRSICIFTGHSHYINDLSPDVFRSVLGHNTGWYACARAPNLGHESFNVISVWMYVPRKKVREHLSYDEKNREYWVLPPFDISKPFEENFNGSKPNKTIRSDFEEYRKFAAQHQE